MDKNYKIIVEALKRCVFSNEDPNSTIIILEFDSEDPECIKVTTTNTKTKMKKVETVKM